MRLKNLFLIVRTLSKRKKYRFKKADDKDNFFLLPRGKKSFKKLYYSADTGGIFLYKNGFYVGFTHF
jgi:hypothetical protein